MSTSEPSGQQPSQPNEPYTATERAEEVAADVGLIAAVLATPYLIVSHVRGHRAGHAVLRHRLGHALHALLDIAPHRLLAAIRRGHPAR